MPNGNFNNQWPTIMTAPLSGEPNEPTIAEWFQRGVDAFKKPDGVAAVEAFRKVVSLDPSYRHSDGDNAYFYLGKIHEVEGNLEDAIIMYTRALSLDCSDEESLIGRGSCYTVLNQPENAISDFKKVLSLGANRRAPMDQIYYAIGENYRKQGKWPQAWKWGKMAQSQNPHSELIKKLVDDATAWLEG